MRAANWDVLPRAGIAELFAAVLGPARASEIAGLPFEALFRMAGARSVERHFMAFPDVAPALRQLAELNVPCLVSSSGWSAIVERKAERIGFEGPLLLAEDLDVPLTSPQALARVARTLMLPADRIWFVGTDLRRDVLPARAVGMRTVWLNREGAQLAAECTPPDVTIASLEDLIAVLSEPYTRGVLALRYILGSILEMRPGHVVAAADRIFEDDATR